VGCADGIANHMNGEFHKMVSRGVTNRCGKASVSISLNKVVLIPFARKRDIRALKEPTLCGKSVQLST
jgi:hypothetical protein